MGRDQVLASYQLIKTLGKGRYSTVKLAKQLMTDELVAIKIVSKTDNTPKELEILMQV
jgi:serine/threonine protein kinase